MGMMASTSLSIPRCKYKYYRQNHASGLFADHSGIQNTLGRRADSPLQAAPISRSVKERAKTGMGKSALIRYIGLRLYIQLGMRIDGKGTYLLNIISVSIFCTEGPDQVRRTRSALRIPVSHRFYPSLHPHLRDCPTIRFLHLRSHRDRCLR